MEDIAPNTASSLQQSWVLKFYVDGNCALNDYYTSALQERCARSLGGNFSLEVIDLTRNPERAEKDLILAVPTLIRVSPRPVRKIIGNFADLDAIGAALDLPAPAR